MKMTRRPSLAQLTFLPNFFPVNGYLVEEDDGLTLIDCALPYSAKGILQAAARIGKPIVRIVLTHAHEDHVGALDALKGALPDAPVHISERDARLMAGDRTLDPGESPKPIKGGVPKKLRTAPDVLLKDGDRVGSLLAIRSPGHTPGSMAFLDTRNGNLIAGDAIQVRGGAAVAGQFKPLFPFPMFGTWCGATALESVRRLAEHRPTLLAVGHGRMLAEPAPVLRRIIAEAERHLTKH